MKHYCTDLLKPTRMLVVLGRVGWYFLGKYWSPHHSTVSRVPQTAVRLLFVAFILYVWATIGFEQSFPAATPNWWEGNQWGSLDWIRDWSEPEIQFRKCWSMGALALRVQFSSRKAWTLITNLLDIIHRLFFIKTHDVSETGVCLRQHVE
jgi:hypothetical protein